MKYNFLFKLSSSFLLIILLLYITDIKSTIAIIEGSNYYWLGIAVLFIFINVFISAIRLKYLLNIFKYKKDVFFLSKIYLIGNFYNNFLPTQMGGDIYKAYRLSNEITLQKKKLDRKEIIAESTFVIFMDRLSGLIVLYVIGLFGLSFLTDTLFWEIPTFIIALVILLVSFIFYYYGIRLLSKKFKIVQQFKDANKIFIKNKKGALYVFVSALFVQLVAIFTQIFCLFSVGIKVSVIYPFLFIPIITIMGLIPSINGVGIQDIGFVYFFDKIGVIQEEAFAASILYHFVRLVASIVGGIILLFDKRYKS